MSDDSNEEALNHYLMGFGLPPMSLARHAPAAPGFKPRRAALYDDRLQLPADEADFRLLRAIAAHAAAHLLFSPRRRPAGNRQPMLVAMMSLIEDARVERLMAEHYPGLHGLWGLFHDATAPSAGFDFYGLAARLAHALHDPAYEDGNVWVAKGRSLFEQAATDLQDVPAFDRLARMLAIDIEKMRLPFNAAAYREAPLYRDDNALLWDFNIPSLDDPVETIVKEQFEIEQHPDFELPENIRLVDVDPRRRTLYPEWDCVQEKLLDDWATVIEDAPPRKSLERALRRFAHGRRRVLVKGLAQAPDRAVRLNRLEEGDELDLTAAVDSVVARASRIAPDPRIFRRHGRRRRNAAIVLLMDLSISTERFVPGSFTKVIDVEKRAAMIVADSLDASRDRIAVHGFSSNGREEVNYVRIKDFDDDFGPEQVARLKREQGRLSTRMGAALRHAGASLRSEKADHKLILLLTDGEPSDIDVDSPDYLVEDARHAVTTAATQGIKTFCLTLDRHADRYVRRIFGERNYLIADKAASFAGYTAQSLVKLISL